MRRDPLYLLGPLRYDGIAFRTVLELSQIMNQTDECLTYASASALTDPGGVDRDV